MLYKTIRTLGRTEEFAQFVNRFFIGVAITLYTGSEYIFGTLSLSPLNKISPVFLLSTGFLISSVLLFLLLLCRIIPVGVIRFSGMVVDIGALTYGLFLAPNVIIPLFFVYLWVTIGYGFRFGKNYLLYCASLSIISALSVLIFKNLNVLETRLMFGVLVALVLIPGYAFFLLSRLEEQNDMLVEQTNKANAANLAKGEFLSNVSHELRTPLNGIIASAEMFTQQSWTEADKGILRTILDSSYILKEQIETILDYSRLEEGRLELDNDIFDLYDAATIVCNTMRPLATAKNLGYYNVIDIPKNMLLVGDRTRISQILFNLIGNATKFTEQGLVSVDVRLKNTKADHAHISIQVLDTGIGIPEEKQSAMFERFNQADMSITRRYGGTGLGLAITKELVELMGGKITLSSKVGQGTRFFIDIVLPTVHASIVEYWKLDLLFAGTSVQNTISDQLIKCGFNFANLDNTQLQLLYSVVHLWAIAGRDDKIVMIPMHENINETISICEDIRKHTLGIVQLCLITTNHHSPQTVSKIFDKVLVLPASNSQITHTVGIESAMAVRRSANKNTENDIVPVVTRSLNVLVADDNHINRTICTKIMESHGHKTFIAHDGDEALEILSQHDINIDLAVIDYHMPGLDGLELVKLWRANEAPNLRLPFILITADAPGANSQELGNDIDAYLTKPLTPNGLLRAVSNIFKNKDQGNNIVEIKPRSPAPVNEAPLLNTIEMEEIYRPLYQHQYPTEALGIISAYRKDLKRNIDGLNQSLNDGNIKKVLQFLHALKGSSAEFRATKLALTIAKAEKDIKQNDDSISIANAWHKTLTQLVNETNIAIDEYIVELDKIRSLPKQ